VLDVRATSVSGQALNIHIITEDDPLYVVRFFELFFARLPRDRIEISGVTVSPAFHEPLLSTASRVHRFYGSADFARLLLRWACAKASGTSIASLARASGFQLVPAASVNDPAFVERIRASGTDLIVSVAAPEVFKAPLLSAPRMGCINIHSGRLPQYRGMMPTFWQMRAGEPCATVTIHEMAERLDAGGVIATLDFPLHERDSLDRVIVGTKRAGAELMIETLLRYDPASGARPAAKPMDMATGSYYRFPDPKSVAEFRARGHRLL
jgi:methionyl-tRNA formyltransferase